MNKPLTPADPELPAETVQDPKPKPATSSAVRLPPGVAPKVSNGPQARKSWSADNAGRPQKDFARRAGKSRKVH